MEFRSFPEGTYRFGGMFERAVMQAFATLIYQVAPIKILRPAQYMVAEVGRMAITGGGHVDYKQFRSILGCRTSSQAYIKAANIMRGLIDHRALVQDARRRRDPTGEKAEKLSVEVAGLNNSLCCLQHYLEIGRIRERVDFFELVSHGLLDSSPNGATRPLAIAVVQKAPTIYALGGMLYDSRLGARPLTDAEIIERFRKLAEAKARARLLKSNVPENDERLQDLSNEPEVLRAGNIEAEVAGSIFDLLCLRALVIEGLCTRGVGAGTLEALERERTENEAAQRAISEYLVDHTQDEAFLEAVIINQCVPASAELRDKDNRVLAGANRGEQ